MTKLQVGEARDCGPYSLSVGAGIPYDEAHEILRQLGRKNRRGTYLFAMDKAVRGLGGKLMSLRPMQFKTFLKRYKTGTYIVFITGHYTVVRDGEAVDRFDVLPGKKVKTAWKLR